MNFENMSDRDKETALMPLILTALQKLGGEASRNDVRTAVAEMNDDIATVRLVIIVLLTLSLTLLLRLWLMQVT